eukprot:TRINITY_DN45390_c0_g1_i5.p1 TRINITY_DN45390_c0_g1~~TRINITY_DN45390_c0_g1_i5.p1  ORF type:complete len:475 (+),score=27.45 TRINITY_DN45390_c0_g1_i5:162-1586(+)
MNVNRLGLVNILLLIHSIYSDEQCDDIAPGNLSCIQQAQWGKCSRKWLSQWGYCRRSCGLCSSQGQKAACIDVPPDATFSCAQQKKWGKCDSTWMKEHHCRVTCGKCTGMQACTDIAPDTRYTCAQQKQFGQCSQSWLIERNFCRRTCGHCLQVKLDLEISLVNQFSLVDGQVGKGQDEQDQQAQSDQCSILSIFRNHEMFSQSENAKEFFEMASNTSDKNLVNYLNQDGYEGLILLPTEAILQRYLPVLEMDLVEEIAKFYIAPKELNEQTIGPYEFTLADSSVRLIRDELVENEFASSSASVVDIISFEEDEKCAQDLEIWVINGLVVPPGIEKPTPLRPSPSGLMLIQEDPYVPQPISYLGAPQPLPYLGIQYYDPQDQLDTPYSGLLAQDTDGYYGYDSQTSNGLLINNQNSLGLLAEDTPLYSYDPLGFLVEDVYQESAQSTPGQVQIYPYNYYPLSGLDFFLLEDYST